MVKNLSKLSILLALMSSSAFALSSSNWQPTAAYGVLIPTSTTSTWPEIDYIRNDSTKNIDPEYREMKLKNPVYFDVGLSHKATGIGLIYSASAKKAEIVPSKLFTDAAVDTTDTDDLSVNTNGFSWKYSGFYANYSMPIGKILRYSLSLGNVKQTLENKNYPGKKSSSTNLSFRFGLGASYNLSGNTAVMLSAAYHHFKEFNIEYKTGVTSTAENELELTDVKPKFNASGFAGAVSLVYNA